MPADARCRRGYRLHQAFSRHKIYQASNNHDNARRGACAPCLPSSSYAFRDRSLGHQDRTIDLIRPTPLIPDEMTVFYFDVAIICNRKMLVSVGHNRAASKRALAIFYTTRIGVTLGSEYAHFVTRVTSDGPSSSDCHSGAISLCFPLRACPRLS